MKLLIDAQLPHLLCQVFEGLDIEAFHVNGLPDGDETSDNEIAAFADENNYMVVTKDVDFYHSYMLLNVPKKLFLIQTGNIKNRQLFDLIRENLNTIKELGKVCSYMELNEDGVFGH